VKKPNVLFLFSDQHNAKCMSSKGHPDVKTPNLDRLAAGGMSFDNAYANNPICTPSRMSFLTSLYPSTHGYYGLYGHEPAEPMTTMFSWFKKHGYRTGALGKLHTPRYLIERDCQFVYDEFIEHPKYLEGAGFYDKNDNRPFAGRRDGEMSCLPYEHSCESALAKQAIRFINNEGEPKDRGDSDSPWFGWISFSRPHQPYTSSKEFFEMYNENDLILPPIGSRGFAEGYNEARIRKELRAYLALCSQVDHAIGTILQGLKSSGQDRDTVIVYSSDHGDYAGEHGAMEKVGGISYRAVTQVPLILNVPGIKNAGKVSDAIIESVDLFPTLCQLINIPIPNTVQGKSFIEILTGKVDSIRTSALTENPYRKALATKEWRYVANIDSQKDELYNIVDDPWELNNRIDDTEYKDTAGKMLRELLDRVARARKPVNTINGHWHEHCYDDDGRVDLVKDGSTNSYW
jgi:arylsulfatase